MFWSLFYVYNLFRYVEQVDNSLQYSLLHIYTNMTWERTVSCKKVYIFQIFRQVFSAVRYGKISNKPTPWKKCWRIYKAYQNRNTARLSQYGLSMFPITWYYTAEKNNYNKTKVTKKTKLKFHRMQCKKEKPF